MGAVHTEKRRVENITLSVEFFASLRTRRPPKKAGAVRDGDNRYRVKVREGSCVKEILALFDVNAHRTLVLVNGIYAREEKRFADGDTVSVFPPIAGGAHGG